MAVLRLTTSKVASFDLAEFDGIVQCHRNPGGAGVTVFLRDHVALLDWNVAPLGGDLNRGLADLGEEQLINLICREAALIAQASEEATSSKKLISMLYRKHICVEIGNPLLAFLRDSQVA